MSAPNTLQMSEAGAVAALTEKLAHVEQIRLGETLSDNQVVAVLPAGKQLHSLKKFYDEWLERPERRSGTATLDSLQSFCAHLVTYAGSDTAVFVADARVDRDAGRSVPAEVRTVYDYTPQGGDQTAASWQEYGASYALRWSQEWLDWTRAGESPMDMATFAQFLEERVSDVYLGETAPHILDLIGQLELTLASAGTLVKLSRNFAVNVGVAVREVRTLSSGEMSVAYEESHRDGEGQAIKVPNAFLIAIPVFEGAPAYQILVRLYYRASGGAVRWQVKMHRPDAVRRAAIDQVAESVRTVIRETEMNVPVFIGRPED
jgi:hypothetical protein